MGWFLKGFDKINHSYIIESMKELTHKEVASRGGKATLKRYGKEHFSKLGKIKGKKHNTESTIINDKTLAIK